MKVLLVSLSLIIISTGAFALTPAGTLITAQAEMQCVDADGVPVSAASNQVSLVVDSRTVRTDMNPPRAGMDVTAGCGTTAYIPMNVTNMGDAPDAYDRIVEQAPAGYIVKFLADDNADGIHQDTETTEAVHVDWLAPGQQGGHGFIAITIPTDAVVGVQADVTVRTVSVVDPAGGLGVGYDYTVMRITPANGKRPPKITILASLAPPSAAPGETYELTLDVTNEGDTEARDAYLTVPVPEYSLLESTDYVEDGGIVRVPIPNLAPGQTTSVALTFRVR